MSSLRMSSENKRGLPRRLVLKGLGALAGMVWFSNLPRAQASVAPSFRGKTVIVRDPKAAEGIDAPTPKLMARWITRAVEELTGQKGKGAWLALFSPKDRVAIKINAMGGANIATRKGLAFGIAQALIEAGVEPGNIIIWDRSSRELEKAGYTIVENGSGPLCFGTDSVGYEPLPRVHKSIGGCFSPILTRWCTGLVNVPVLKDHDLSGVSLSMKNLFGVIHNPNKYHDSGCTPYLVDLLEHPEVARKLKLNVCDGLRAQCHGGPAYNPRWAWQWGGIIVGTDAVAVDRVGESLISQRRKEKGLPSLEEEGRPATHIVLAAQRGLGEGDLGSIELKEVGA